MDGLPGALNVEGVAAMSFPSCPSEERNNENQTPLITIATLVVVFVRRIIYAPDLFSKWQGFKIFSNITQAHPSTYRVEGAVGENNSKFSIQN